MKMKQKKHPNKQIIIFDGHGTITYPKKSTLNLYYQICKNYNCFIKTQIIKNQYQNIKRKYYLFLKKQADLNKKITSEEDRKYWFYLESKFFESLGIVANYYKISKQILDNYMNPINQKIYQDVVPILKYLKYRNYKICIITNSDRRYRKILNFHQIDKYFNHIFISGEIGYKKPNRKLFQYVANYLKSNIDNFYYIGDQYKLDILSAQKAGISNTILLLRNKSKTTKIKLSRNCEIIHSLKSLKNIL